jgi:hypothetical protein
MVASTHLRSPPAGDPERVAGRYELIERIAQGGMGEVFVARELATSRRIALKRLLPSAHKRQALFRAEYHVLARLKHPFIIEVYEFGFDRDCPYYTMELLDGHDLRESPQVSVELGCRILRDVACSLAMLHGQRLLHRDVSPRNVRRTSSGVCKLIDFGTMVPFGLPPDVAGTAPFMSPEAREGSLLDQRSDLYSLGAVAYWLFSRRLPGGRRSSDGTASPPALPPLLRKVAQDVPAELEELVMSLLELDPNKRPGSAMEVIARLSAIGGLPAEDSAKLARAHLGSSRFVGQRRSLARAEKLLRRALVCDGGSGLVEAEEGSGKTRFLQEISLLAQTHGFSVVRAFASRSGAAGAVARDLYFGLRRAAPEVFELVPAAERSLLASFDWQRSAEPSARSMGTRAQLSWALLVYFRCVARAGPWLVLVDDLDLADEFSAAFVAALAASAETLPLLVVASCGRARAELASLGAFGERAQRLSLLDLSEKRTRSLVSDLFGHVPNRERVVAFLYREAHGNPALTMELCRFLLERGVIRYLDGGFVLPESEIREQLPVGTALAFSLRLEGLSPAARELAELIATCRGGASLELCLLGSEQRSDELLGAVNELISRGVLMGNGQEYVFAQETLRSGVRAGITGERQRQLHAHLGSAFLQLGGAHARLQLEAAWHLMHTEREREAAELLYAITPPLIEAGVSYQHAIEGLEKALEVLERLQAPLEARLAIRSQLARASYLHDYRLADRYADATIESLYDWTAMPVVARWRRFIPRRYALLVCIVIISQRRLFRPPARRGPRAVAAIRHLANAVISTLGVRITALDHAAGAQLMAKLWAFQHAFEASSAPIAYAAAEALALQPFGREAELSRKLVAARRPIERRRPINMTEADRQDLLIGLRLSGGINECYRIGSRALALADELATQGTRMAQAAAHRIRFTYYVVRGMRDRAEDYRRELDIHGLQGGTTWQVEWFAVPTEGMASAMLGDVVGAGQALERLERLVAEIPSLVPLRDMVRVGYHVQRGEHALAIELGARFVREHPARSVIGWAAAYAAYAAALNGSQRHAQASELCERALATLTPDDLEYVIMYGPLAREFAMARAGCGDPAQARQIAGEYVQRLRQHGEFALLAHAYESVLGVARQLGDQELLATALVGMREAAEQAGSSSVAEHAAKVTQAQLRAAADQGPAPSAKLESGRTYSSDATPAGGIARTRRRALLRRLVDHSGARSAFVLACSEADAALKLLLLAGAPVAPAALLAALQPWSEGLTPGNGGASVERLARVAIEGRSFQLLRMSQDGDDEIPVLLLLERDGAAEELPAMLLARLTDEVRAGLSFEVRTSDSGPDSDRDPFDAGGHISEPSL